MQLIFYNKSSYWQTNILASPLLHHNASLYLNNWIGWLPMMTPKCHIWLFGEYQRRKMFWTFDPSANPDLLPRQTWSLIIKPHLTSSFATIINSAATRGSFLTLDKNMAACLKYLLGCFSMLRRSRRQLCKLRKEH